MIKTFPLTASAWRAWCVAREDVTKTRRLEFQNCGSVHLKRLKVSVASFLRCFCTSAVLVALCSISSLYPARAAKIVEVKDSRCAVALEGEIVSGDANRIVSLLQKYKFAQANDLCLNSQGGSFEEA